MGNRAVITTRKRDLGVYLHWNGGRDSVEAFLEYCRLRGFRAPETDDYGWARLCQVVCNYMGGGGLSVGVWPYTTDEAALSAGDDNGVYVTEGWRVVGRVLPWEGFEEQREYDLEGMLREIDRAQPEEQRLGAYLDAEEVPVGEVRPGDTVFVREVGGALRPYPVVGIGDEGRVVNGVSVGGLPYVARYWNGGWQENCNNFLREETVRRVRDPWRSA